MAEELPEHRLKRLRMRSMRRGIKEMDLILLAYADRSLAGMDEDRLKLYDRMLNESDHDLYSWVNGQVPPPDTYAALIADIQADIVASRAG